MGSWSIFGTEDAYKRECAIPPTYNHLAFKKYHQAALILGLRRMEWLFITCHNYWIVCCLVRDDHHPFLAYSPMISIDGSSVPFRALLGAILSVVKKVPVEPIKFNPNMKLDTLVKGQDECPSPKDDIDDGSPYSARSGEEIANDPPNTRTHHRTGQRAESWLMVCPCLLLPVFLLTLLFLRSPRLPKICLNPLKSGYVSAHSQTIFSPFRSAPRMGIGACG